MKVLAVLMYSLMLLNNYSLENVKPREVDVPILTFHDFTLGEKFNGCRISEEKFVEVLDAVENEGYKAVSFEELIDFTKCQNNLPEKPIVITMDDGYRSNYDVAYPILKERNMKAVVSVIGTYVGQHEPYSEYPWFVPYMNWKEIKEMSDSGVFEIGNHTYDLHNLKVNGYVRNGVLTNKGETKEKYANLVKKDILYMNDLINKQCNTKCKIFCYPYGYRNAITDEVIENFGFDVTLSTVEGVNKIKRGSKLFNLKRVNVTMKTKTDWVIRKIKKG